MNFPIYPWKVPITRSFIPSPFISIIQGDNQLPSIFSKPSILIFAAAVKFRFSLSLFP